MTSKRQVVKRLAIHRIHGEEVTPYDIAQIQENIRIVLDDLADRRQNFGKQISSVSLATSQENLVEHGLERAVSGWWITDIETDANVWRDDSTSSDTSRYLVLRTDAACVVDLVVF